MNPDACVSADAFVRHASQLTSDVAACVSTRMSQGISAVSFETALNMPRISRFASTRRRISDKKGDDIVISQAGTVTAIAAVAVVPVF